MRSWWRGIAWLLVLLAVGSARAGEGRGAPAEVAGLKLPPGLPRYELAIRIDTEKRKVAAREQVTFTNRSEQPVRELVFHVYPRYKVPESDKLILRRTL